MLLCLFLKPTVSLVYLCSRLCRSRQVLFSAPLAFYWLALFAYFQTSENDQRTFRTLPGAALRKLSLVYLYIKTRPSSIDVRTQSGVFTFYV
jgi:hypothetical protein